MQWKCHRAEPRETQHSLLLVVCHDTVCVLTGSKNVLFLLLYAAVQTLEYQPSFVCWGRVGIPHTKGRNALLFCEVVRFSMMYTNHLTPQSMQWTNQAVHSIKGGHSHRLCSHNCDCCRSMDMVRVDQRGAVNS